MKSIIYFLLFFISYAAFSQQKAIEVTNKKTGKVVLFEENQRIKIRTLAGKKYVGNLKIQDSLSFSVDSQSVKIDSLKNIKVYPKKLATFKKVLFIGGLATLGASVIAAATGSGSAFMLFTIGAVSTISSGILEGINKNNSSYSSTYKIIQTNAIQPNAEKSPASKN
ncbi:MAG TPA: hypothetical protein VIV55_08960 [Flavobacterium sp.]